MTFVSDGEHDDDGLAASEPWCIDSAVEVHAATHADAVVRAEALAPAEAAQWWRIHVAHGDTDLRERQTQRLWHGEDLLVLRPQPTADTGRHVEPVPLPDVPDVPPPPRPRPRDENTYIEIVLLDELGEPIADEPYEIRLPDGRVVTGTLDEHGSALVEGIKPGSCEVRFPGVHHTELGAG
ncbi:MAG: hypothetical protein IAG13_26380 [Deltaproteobacteria bacterium]|nr:hypothetical protein [Nannocystaceae bacterium]